MYMNRVEAVCLFLLPLLFLVIACADDETTADPPVVPDPRRATAVAGEEHTGAILIGGRAMDFLASTCDIQGDRFNVKGSGVSEAQPFTIDMNGDASVNQLSLRVEMEGRGTEGGGDLRTTWEATGQPSRVEIGNDDERQIEAEADVRETNGVAPETPAVSAQVTVSCS